MGLPSDTAYNLVWDISNFQWYMIPILVILIYMIAKETQKENWSGLLAALAFWLMDFINELWNAIVYQETGAAFWSTPGAFQAPGVYEPNSAFVVLVGWNIEIVIMFLMTGIVSTKMFKGTIQEELSIENLDERKAFRKKRLTNRFIMVFAMTLLCIIIEIILNLLHVLEWEWDGTAGYPNIWSRWNPVLIYLIGYLHFWTISAIVYDCKRRWVQLAIVGGMAVIAFGTFIILASIPGYLAPMSFYTP